MRRLLSLDYVLEHPELGWLATEPEKLAYFQRLGISLAVLPHRLHRGPSTDRPTRRYFPLKLPIAGSGTTTTFVYADPGGWRRLQSDRIGSWVARPLGRPPRRRRRRSRRRRHPHRGRRRRERSDPRNLARAASAPRSPLRSRPTTRRRSRTRQDYRQRPTPRQVRRRDQAVKAYRRILDREKAARGPATYIDAYSTHVAERLTPDRLAC